ncbi:MAG: chorismate synthase [Candidatus Hermodarchaeota archaeon]
MDNSIGNIFRITSFGESHGDLVGIIIDGVPVGLDFDVNFIQSELDRRKPGHSYLTTPRYEEDRVKVLSGIFENKTTGAPICLIIENTNIDSSIYEKYRDFLRPSHIDYPALRKYRGFSDLRGSGRFSGRITAGFVMAGAIAKLILKKYKIEIFAYTKSIGGIVDNKEYISNEIKELFELREKSLIGAVDQEISKLMELLIERIKNQKDSIGGTIKCIVKNFPAGKGGPIFNSLESNISKMIFAIPGIKAIEFGAGFNAATMKGSEHNDPWIIKNGIVQTTKNDAGGIIGGLSTGMPIEFTVAVKPTASISIPQKTVNIETKQNVEIEFLGRHDPCIVPRIIPVVEAMIANVLLDILLLEGFIPRILNS